MATTTVTREYVGQAEKPVPWEAVVRIFDAIWGANAHNLPKFPQVYGAVHGRWWDAQDVRHDATSLEEMHDAYRQFLTKQVHLGGKLQGTAECEFDYWPGCLKARVTVRAGDQTTAERIVNSIRQEFPFVTTRVFISYDTEELRFADFVQSILERRLPPGTEVFVAKRNIDPGADPMKVMLTQNLLQAEALVAMCSKRSKTSPWLWWESSAVWARKGLVVPLFIDTTPDEFDGPISLVCQGRSFFDEAELNSAIAAVVERISPGRPCEGLTLEETTKLEQLRTGQTVLRKSAPD